MKKSNNKKQVEEDKQKLRDLVGSVPSYVTDDRLAKMYKLKIKIKSNKKDGMLNDTPSFLFSYYL